MLYGSHIAVFIQEHSGISYCAQRLSAGTLLCKVRSDILQTDSAHTFFRQAVQHIVSVFVFGPDFQLVPDSVIFINPAVSVLIVPGKVRKTIPALCTEQFTSIIYDAIVIFVQSKISAAASQTGDPVLFSVCIDVKIKFLIRKLRHIGIQIDHQRVAHGEGCQFQILTEDKSPYVFYLYHQLYDQQGKPIEGAYADINNDGQVNSNDRYMVKKPSPDWIFGFSANLRFRQWTLGTSLRANVGNYVFNGMAMNTGAFRTVSYNNYQLNNLSSSYLDTRFQQRQYMSDYYLENASFLKMDNVTLGYNFGRVKDVVNINASVMVQNVFTVTNYSGIDPEIDGGVDLSFYPRPRVFSLSLGFDF